MSSEFTYGRVPVVRVKRADGRGFHYINQSDFDPSKHELDDGGTKSESPKPLTLKTRNGGINAQR